MLVKSLLAAGVIALAAGSANAASFYSFGSGAPTLSLVTDFSGDNVGSAPSSTASGYSWVGGGTGLVLDTTSGDGAEPAIADGVYGTGNYLSVEGGSSETLSISQANIHDIELYVGSLDTYNSLFFAGPNVTITGTQLGVLSGAANGAQTAANTNGVFKFDFSTPVTGITLSSTTNSFEIANIAAGVPEPGVWAMMLIGFGGIGATMRSRRRQVAAA